MKKKTSDDEKTAEKSAVLIAEIKAGKEQSFEQLAKLYSPLIDSLCSKYTPPQMSSDEAQELRQEATLALYRAAVKYNAAQTDVSFGLYAKICAKNAVISVLRKYGRMTAKRSRTDEYDDSVKKPKLARNPLSDMISHEQSQRLKSRIEKVLSEFEYDVFERQLSGARAREIARELGRSEKSVSNAIYRIRSKVRDLLK